MTDTDDAGHSREDLTELAGRQARFVVNLEPRKMFDIGRADAVGRVLAVPEAPVAHGTRAG